MTALYAVTRGALMPPPQPDAFRIWVRTHTFDKVETCPCWPDCWVPPSGPVRLGRREETTTGGRG